MDRLKEFFNHILAEMKSRWAKMDKRQRTYFILLMVLAVVTVMCFTACGGKDEPMTLEKYVQDNADVQESIDNAMAESNVLVEIKENAIIYTFDLSTMEGYTEELAKNDAIKEALEKALNDAGPTFGGIAKSIEESSEIQGISTVVNYTWGDEVLVTKTFTSADAES